MSLIYHQLEIAIYIYIYYYIHLRRKQAILHAFIDKFKKNFRIEIDIFFSY